MKKSRAASRNRNQPWNPNGQATVAVSGIRQTSNVAAATTGGAWSGDETRAANAGTPPPQTRIDEERGGALAARIHEGGGNEGLYFLNPSLIHNSYSLQALALSSTNSETPNKDYHWIFDCGATYTMSFDASDFMEIFPTRKRYIKTASGNLAYVEGAGTIKLSSELCLPNCLYIPSLSHKLVSVSQVTRELHCDLLMQSGLCILQDTRTGKIVGRGTEHRGLYYVDGMAQQGAAMLTQGLTEEQTWLWHRRLGHPSIGYLRLI